MCNSEIISFCRFNCSNCPIYKATISSNLSYRKDIQKRLKKKGIKLSLDEIVCYGCKEKNRPVFAFCKECEIRKRNMKGA